MEGLQGITQYTVYKIKRQGKRQGDVAFVLTKTGDVSMLCLPFEFICFQQLTLTGGLLFARRPFHCLTFSLWRHRRDGPRPRTTPVAQKRREASPDAERSGASGRSRRAGKWSYVPLGRGSRPPRPGNRKTPAPDIWCRSRGMKMLCAR